MLGRGDFPAEFQSHMVGLLRSLAFLKGALCKGVKRGKEVKVSKEAKLAGRWEEPPLVAHTERQGGGWCKGAKKDWPTKQEVHSADKGGLLFRRDMDVC